MSQFARLQLDWADDRDFPRRQTGGKKYLDPVIGHPATKGQQQLPEPQEWPKKWNGELKEPLAFYGCVQTRGGEFFFVPSISFLKNL